MNFYCEDYAALPVLDGAVVYCDPPYKGKTCGYYSTYFDHDRFTDWVDANKRRLTIYISEYKENANPTWETVWERESHQEIRNGDGIRQKTAEILQLAK